MLRNEPIDSITFEDNPAKTGHPVIDGLTLGGVADANSQFSIVKGKAPQTRRWQSG